MNPPVRYAADVEQPEPDEAETIEALKEQFGKILEITSKAYGHAVRSVHAKGHGLVRGVFRIADDLPPELAQGLFAAPGCHDAILRFSTNAGDILDDAIRLPRGVALKVIGVEGERLPGDEGDRTQDFIMVNGPVFAAATPKKFLGNLKLLAATTEKAEGAKKLLSSVLRAFEAGLEAVGTRSTTLTALGGAKPVHPLGATYFSQTAFRYGDHIAKFQLVPVHGVTDLTDETIDARGHPDAIREAMNEALRERRGVWELRAQLCTDLEAMPVEDPTVLWDEELSPFRTVATLTIEPQTAWDDENSVRTEDTLSFSPWHALAAHRPLGGINRVRKDAYAFSSGYRARFNGCPIHEPAAIEDVAV
ncbi:MAG: catalase family protein [Sphingomonas sp.]